MIGICKLECVLWVFTLIDCFGVVLFTYFAFAGYSFQYGVFNSV